MYEARATRRHDRISVRPFLELRVGLRQGSTAGLQLINAGLGPAAITKTVLTLDGKPLGEFSEASVNILRGKLSIRPAAVTFRKTILATGYDQFQLSVEPFDRTEHAEFADLRSNTGSAWRSTTNPFTVEKATRRRGSQSRDHLRAAQMAPSSWRSRLPLMAQAAADRASSSHLRSHRHDPEAEA